MINYRFLASAFIATLVVAFHSNAQNQTPVTSLESIPGESVAYIYADIPSLAEVGGMDFAKAFISQVQPEIDTVILEKWGVRPSELVDAAFVIPPSDALLSSDFDPNAIAFGILSFTNAEAAQNLIKKFDGQWKRFNAQGRKIYVDETTNLALLHFADNAVAFGTQTKLAWFLRQRTSDTRNTSNHLAKSFSYASEGQIAIGINGAAVPQPLKDQLPAGFENFANLQWGALAINLSQGVRLKQVSSFATAADAEGSSKQIKNLLTTAEMLLKGMERTFENQFADRTANHLETDFMTLSQLAGARYALKIAKSVESKQHENQTELNLHVKDFDATPAILICLTAIQAVGQASEEQFQQIATELSAK